MGGELSVETLVPVGVGAQPGRNVVGDNLKNTADGIASAKRKIYLLLHSALRFGIGTAQQNFILGC